jgi:hypothetical protein
VISLTPRIGDVATITVSQAEVLFCDQDMVEFALRMPSGPAVFRLPMSDLYCSVTVEVDPVEPVPGDLWCTELGGAGDQPVRLFARAASRDVDEVDSDTVLVAEDGYEYTPREARDRFGRLSLLDRRPKPDPPDPWAAAANPYVTEVLPIAEQAAAAVVAVPVERPAAALPRPDVLPAPDPATTAVIPVVPGQTPAGGAW